MIPEGTKYYEIIKSSLAVLRTGSQAKYVLGEWRTKNNLIFG